MPLKHLRNTARSREKARVGSLKIDKRCYTDGPQANGKKLSSLLGSILRIDVDGVDKGRRYRIPADNPFVNVAGAAPEIYARNPWRIAFDKENGRLWCGDVGQELWKE
jgi:glucose/arabinose dehydrogenase